MGGATAGFPERKGMVSLEILSRTRVYWTIRGSLLAKMVLLVILFDMETLCCKIWFNCIFKAFLTTKQLYSNLVLEVYR